MAAPSSCPDRAELRRLAEGNVTADEQADLAHHLDGCTDCQAALEQIAGTSDSWGEAAARLQQGAAPADPALVHVMEDLQHDPARTQTRAEPRAQADELPLDFLDPPEKPGQLGKLAHYEILETVGHGGMGIVLKAYDTKLQRIVAIKVMMPELAVRASARQRFIREARAAAAVSHDHVVTIHAVEEERTPPFLVMSYIAGRSLQDRIDQCGTLELKEILRIGMQAASGLAAAHAQGLVHRDIKPANILLENGIERVKITDFGLARAADDARLTQSGIVTGTPQYMSPEQAAGKSVDHRADLFSLGGVLYAMCTGYAPFRASSSLAVLKKVCDEFPRSIEELNPDIPDWLIAIVDKLMAKNPKERIQSATEVASLLGQHLAHMQQPAVFPQPTTLIGRHKAPKSRPDNSWVTVLIVLAILLVVCPVGLTGLSVFVFWLMPSSSPPTTTMRGENLSPSAPGGTTLPRSEPRPENAVARKELLEGLSWFPANATFFGVLDLSAQHPLKIGDPLARWMIDQYLPANLRGLFTEGNFADMHIQRLSFAVIEQPNKPDESRYCIRLTGRTNRTRLSRLLLEQLPGSTAEQGTDIFSDTTTFISLANKSGPGIAIVDDEDILIAGHWDNTNRSFGNRKLLDDMLHMSVDPNGVDRSRPNLTRGSYQRDLDQLPWNVISVVMGDLPMPWRESLSRDKGGPFRVPPRSLTMVASGRNQPHLKITGRFPAAPDVESFAADLETLKGKWVNNLQRQNRNGERLPTLMITGPEGKGPTVVLESDFLPGDLSLILLDFLKANAPQVK